MNVREGKIMPQIERFKVKFTLSVTPKEKMAPVFSRGKAYTPDSARQAERLITMLSRQYRPREPITGPVRLSLAFVFEPPKSWPAWKKDAAILGYLRPIAKPDRDNCEKLTVDGLEAAGFFADDSQVVEGPLEKWYGEKAKIVVEVEEISPGPGSSKEWKAMCL